MTDPNNDNDNNMQVRESAAIEAGDTDAASKSLSEAFSISFVILKIIMGVLVVLFLFSGFETVDYGETALVLRFGKIRSKGGVLKSRSRPYWIMPSPIEEIIKIPVGKSIDLAIDSFWYRVSREELASGRVGRFRSTLDPIYEGYSLTRSVSRTGEIGGNDYNIVHSKWQVIFQIDNARGFFRNVYVEDAQPGEVYFDVVKRSVEPLFKNLIEDAVVTALVNYTVDDITSERMGTVTEHVKRLIQERLNELESGIKVESVNLVDSTWPRQVNDAFEGLHKFSQMKDTMISEARSYAQNHLIEAGAHAEERIAEARANRTKLVETARANAKYLQQILPEYRKRPKLIIEEIYLTALENIFENVDEQFVVESTDKLRLLLNRDPKIKPKSEQEDNQEN